MGRTSRPKGIASTRNKVLLDPYAKAIARETRWSDEMWGYQRRRPARPICRSTSATTPRFAPLAAVVDEAFTWGDDRRAAASPGTRRSSTKCTSRASPSCIPKCPRNLRGTYAGLGSEPRSAICKNLGVTAVELLPVHEHVDDRHLVDSGLVNYWGYNTLGFFAPEPRYAAVDAAGDVVREFKTMVRNLHAAGIEVILDVVYNHTAEGNQLGPTLSFRGIDNASYYRLSPEDPRYYMDFTGCGNTFHMRNPRVLQLIMDSLRYWVMHMHVDGFRFDLASTLARELHEVDKLGAFFDIIHQDPVISQVKLIAEPWDLGAGGYQVGNFPVLWSEWNGKYRDCDPPLLERRRRRGLGIRHAVLRLERPVRMERPPAARQHQFHHLPRRLHAATTWSPTTTSTTKPTAKTIATAPTTTSVGTAASKGRPTTRRS